MSIELKAPTIAVIGTNGLGKSTSAWLLNGLIEPTSGSVTVHGVESVRERDALRRRVGFVFTDPQTQILMPMPAEDLALSLRGRPRDWSRSCCWPACHPDDAHGRPALRAPSRTDAVAAPGR